MAKECAFGGECREIIEASEKIRTLEADNANHYEWRKDVTHKLDEIKESVNGLKDSGTLPMTVKLRVSGKSATGTLYFLPVSVLGREAW